MQLISLLECFLEYENTRYTIDELKRKSILASLVQNKNKRCCDESIQIHGGMIPRNRGTYKVNSRTTT